MKKILVIFILLFPVLILAADKIDINTATLEELDQIVGIGPALGQRIIDARPFSSVDDLLRVKGIGEKTLQKIKDQGLACVGCQPGETRPPENLDASSVEVGSLISYPSGVYINEILPSPEGADETEEWIELYNSNNSEIDLCGWKIRDKNGTTALFILNQGSKITANGYLVLKRPETKILLNNDEDGLDLLAPDEKIKDTVSYVKAPLGQSYSKTNSGWQWSKTLTPAAVNIITAATKALPKTQKSDNNIVEAKDLTANLSQNNNNTNPWVLFFMASAITIISAASVLLLKYKFKNLKI